MLGAGNRFLHHLDELPCILAIPKMLRRSSRMLMQNAQPLRSELQLETAQGENIPLLVRGDPAVSLPDRMLGFVLTFTDLTERKAAESARRRFQEGASKPPSSFGAAGHSRRSGVSNSDVNDHRECSIGSA
jgi:hypothetical protein